MDGLPRKASLLPYIASKGAQRVIVLMYRYVEELEGNEASSSGWDVLFYGDSIMEEWRCCTFPFACKARPKLPIPHSALGCIASPADVVVSPIERLRSARR